MPGSKGWISYDGVTFGLKHHEFRAVLPLPTMVDADFELALHIHPADDVDRRALRQWGCDAVE